MIQRVTGIVDPSGIEILPDIEPLMEGEITLTPGSLPEDIGLVMKFAMGDRYNQTPEPQLVKGLELCKYLWIGRVDGVIGGIIALCYLENLDKWSLDAYKNDEHDNRIGDYSFRAGRLVRDWFFKKLGKDKLITIHRTQNFAATKVCERLGFEITHRLGDAFTVLTLERDVWDGTGSTTR